MGDKASVRLREVIPEDIPIHFEQQRDPISSAMADVPARERAAFDAHLERVLADPTVVIRTVEAEGRVAGNAVSFLREGERQVGYWIARDLWGRGIASAALTLLLEAVTERPLYARVAAANPASLRVLEKHGFACVAEERDGGDRICVLRLS